jgi:hypothetical protein
MEFSGRGDQCFGKVKAAIKTKILGDDGEMTSAMAGCDRCSPQQQAARRASGPRWSDFSSATR